jgi:hypothetical protein
MISEYQAAKAWHLPGLTSSKSWNACHVCPYQRQSDRTSCRATQMRLTCFSLIETHITWHRLSCGPVTARHLSRSGVNLVMFPLLLFDLGVLVQSHRTSAAHSEDFHQCETLAHLETEDRGPNPSFCWPETSCSSTGLVSLVKVPIISTKCPIPAIRSVSLRIYHANQDDSASLITRNDSGNNSETPNL